MGVVGEWEAVVKLGPLRRLLAYAGSVIGAGNSVFGGVLALKNTVDSRPPGGSTVVHGLTLGGPSLFNDFRGLRKSQRKTYTDNGGISDYRPIDGEGSPC